jgi:hypothetical protein
MFSRTSKYVVVAGLTLSLAACGSGDTNADLKAAEQAAAKDAAAGGKIECALAGSTSFDRKCTTERVTGPEGALLVIRHPDGGFRRFKILTDGRGLAPADGTDPDFNLKVLGNGMIEVRSVDDIYRLPAVIKGEAEKQDAAK